MSEWIIFINESVVIFEIVLAAIIRRVDVDNINLARVCVRKLRQCSEVVALDYEVIRSIGVIRNNRVDFFIVALDEYRQVFPEAFFNVFGLFFPYKPILFMTSYKFEQRSFFLVAQPFKG